MIGERPGRAVANHWLPRRGADGSPDALDSSAPTAMRRPKVAMVASRYLPSVGGTEMHVYEVARRLAERAHVTVLSLTLPGQVPGVSYQGNVVVKRFSSVPRSGDLRLSGRLLRAIRRDGYDLVHVQGVHTMLAPAVLWVALRSGLPTVVTLHTGGHSGRIRSALRDVQWRALGPLLRRCDAVVAVCDYEVDRFSRISGLRREQFRLVRNGSDTLPVGAVSAFHGEPLIVSVGRLERYKGHHRLIAAMPTVIETSPHARLVIVGQGHFEQPLRAMARRLGVEGSVSFVAFGPEERSELGALLTASDLVALMSDYEAHPVAVMEALALGRKVLVADTSGLSELASHGLVSVADPRLAPPALARAVLHAVEAPMAPDQPALPTWSECARDLWEVYDEVLSGAGFANRGPGIAPPRWSRRRRQAWRRSRRRLSGRRFEPRTGSG